MIYSARSSKSPNPRDNERLTMTVKNNCTSDWGIPDPGSKRWAPLMPDKHATYWPYAINRDIREPDNRGFKFKGQFAHARYQSFHVYDDFDGSLVWPDPDGDGKPTSSLLDSDIEPDDGNENPYLPNVNRNTRKRDYTVWVVPEGSDTSSYANASNVITFRRDVEKLSVYLRVYLPDENLKGQPHYLSGGVPLPEIECFDTANPLQPAECPTARLIAGTGEMPTGPPVNEYGEVHFYRIDTGDFYTNQHSAYVVSVFKDLKGTVAVIKFKPPTFTDTSHPRASFPEEQTELRYWSLNVCSGRLTNTTACLADYQATVACDGFVYVVLAKALPHLIEHALGLNFLPWGPRREGPGGEEGDDAIVLAYRHMVIDSEFRPNSAAAVPIGQAADMGETPPMGDYAPVGRYFTEAEFLENFGNFDVNYA